jgi:hypothetical protein
MAGTWTHYNRAAWPLIWTLLAALALQPAYGQDRGASPYPPADRLWNSADYRALMDIVGSGQAPLPTLADPSGKAVFGRMVNVENTALWRAPKPAGAHMEEMAATLEAVNALLRAYMKEAQRGKPYEGELARLMVYIFTMTSMSIGVADEFIATIPKNDRYETRMAGLRQMQQGSRTVFAAMVQNIAETRFYSKASTLEMAGSVVTHVPSFQRILTDQDRQDHLRGIGRQLDMTTDGEVKSALMAMRDAIGKVN